MGLVSNPKYGVKTQLIARFPQAFFRAESLVDAREKMGVKRADTVLSLDGTVLAHQLGTARTYAECKDVLFATLANAGCTAQSVFVAYDEPASVTSAKANEQTRRDTAHQVTADQWTRGDAYAEEELRTAANIRPIMDTRLSRLRAIDQMALDALNHIAKPEELASYAAQRLAGAFADSELVFDGIDPRGAGRRLDEERVAQIVSGNPVLQTRRRGRAVGEADLKLSLLLRTTSAMQLAIVVTVDSDAFCIELLERARQLGGLVEPPSARIVCMRTAAKRDVVGNIVEDSHYLCVNVGALFDALQQHYAAADERAQRRGTFLFAAGMALCGCDFTRLKGLRPDVVLDCLPTVVSAPSTNASACACAWDGGVEDVRGMLGDLRMLTVACATRLWDMPRMRRQSGEVRNVNDETLMQAAWVGAYWCANELPPGDFHFGSTASSICSDV